MNMEILNVSIGPNPIGRRVKKAMRLEAKRRGMKLSQFVMDCVRRSATIGEFAEAMAPLLDVRRYPQKEKKK